MKVPNIFRIGNSDDKMKDKTLGENLSALFGADEGKTLTVSASEEGATAIDAAEAQLISISATIKEANQAVIQAKTDAAEKITALQADHEKEIAAKDAEIERLGNLPGANHTTPKSSDVATGDDGGKVLFSHQKAANQAIEKARNQVKPD